MQESYFSPPPPPPEPRDPYAPKYLPRNEHLDAFPDESVSLTDSRALSEWDVEFQKRIEKEFPDEKLLTKEQEKELASSVQAGLKAAKRLVSPRRLTEVQKDELLDAVEDGQAARDTLVVSNLRLAAWFVRNTMDLNKKQREAKGQKGQEGAIHRDLSRFSGGELEYADRMQIASIGLMNAARTFSGENRFSTWAMWAMERELSRTMFKPQSPLNIPADKASDISKFVRTKESMQEDLQREPTTEEIAMQLDTTPQRAKWFETLSHAKQNISFEQIEAQQLLEQREMQILDKDHEPITIADQLVDPKTNHSVFDKVAIKELGYRLDMALADLSQREQAVIEARFGLLTGEALSLEEAGALFGLSRLQIRAIESKTLAKLREPKRAEFMIDFLDTTERREHNASSEYSPSDETELTLGLTKPSKYIFEDQKLAVERRKQEYDRRAQEYRRKEQEERNQRNEW